MDSSKIRVGIIGAGAIGHEHLRVFSNLQDEVSIEAVADPNLELASARAKEFSVEKVYQDTDEIIADPAIDAIVIGVPNKWHAAIAIAALKARKHVLIEKPMALNGDAAREIYNVQQETGKILMVAHQFRFMWKNMEVKKQIEKGALGKIYHAKASYNRRKGIPGWGSWFTQMELSGGGALIDIGVHMLDLSLWLMGNPKPISVYGATYAEFGPEKRGLGTWGTPNWDGKFDVDDLASAMIRMDNGATLTLDVSWAAHTELNEKQAIRLMGTQGGASITNDSTKLLTEHFDRPVDVELTPPNHIEGERTLLAQHFIQCVKENKQPISPAVSGLAVNLILDAIYESSKTGSEVKINWKNNE